MKTWNRFLHATRTIFAVTAAAALAAACGDSATGPGSGGQVSLSLAAGGTGSTQSARRAVPGPSLDVTQTDGQGNELVLDSVKVVLREIELKRQVDDCPDDGSGDSGSDDDACEEFSTDIRLFDVPLDGSVEQVLTVQAPVDTYDELEFEVHKPDDDDQQGRQFIEDNPAFADVSIRAVGTFNGEPFVYETDLNEDQEVQLDPPLVVEEGGDPVNVTLRLDVSTWFVDSSGALVDPREADLDSGNSAAQDLVEANIESSIEVFEDDDGDGEAED